MKRQIILIGTAALATGLLLFPAAAGQVIEKPDQYSAVWAAAEGVAGGKPVPFDIRINRYNTDADIQKFSDLLKAKGADALRLALEIENNGLLSTQAHRYVPIAIARKVTDGKKTTIRVLVARDLWFMELRFSGHSADYPFTILQLDLDRNGNGTGTAIAAAKIQFNKKEDTYEIESLEKGKEVNKLLDVKLVK